MLTLDKLTISVLQALHGDALHIRYFGKDRRCHNIFIDGGFAKTYKATVRQATRYLIERDERIDLFVITHVDADHISGVLSFIKEFGDQNMVDRYWFNSTLTAPQMRFPGDKISVAQGITLRDYLLERALLPEHNITTELGTLNIAGGAAITILAPDSADLTAFQQKWDIQEKKRKQEHDKIAAMQNDYTDSVRELGRRRFQGDRKLENRSSIAFLFRLDTSCILFLADSHPSTIANSLRQLGYSTENKLMVDYAKISHHGSKHNTSDELLALLDCTNFMISANGKNRYRFPHKEALSRILVHPTRRLDNHIQFIFNYDNDVLRSIFTENEQAELNFSCLYPESGTNGYTIHCNPYRHD